MSFENKKPDSRPFVTKNNASFETMKSSGPGGQNVDKRSTAVRLRFKVDDLPFDEKEKDLVRKNLPPRHITKDGEIIIENSSSRSQKENRENTIRIANEEIRKAIEKAKNKKAREKHKKRARKRQKKGGSSKPKNKKEAKQKQYRSETTEDLIERAIDEDPDLKDKLSND